ncbi:uncharacterized protein [Aegilops tauschii subsp. strangulata]|uniref:uncharacterized protein n=1 Tax=Aegilops tauschii subsp. strangulata TaxID=200361 RepID=UPI00098AFF71|nr:uncharacterized protein LOC109759342 [Aegilops tauschii subsp. strangulata]
MECNKDAALGAKEAAERKFETMTTIFNHAASMASKRKRNVGSETSAMHHNVHMPFQENEASMPQTENVHAVQAENQDASSARKFEHVNVGRNVKVQPPTKISLAKSIDKDEMRKLLIKRAKSCLSEKLREIRSNKNGSGNNTDAEKEDDQPSRYIVPDPHFHDFDKDRTEESFQSGQVWASYGDKDGMPHCYVLIKKRISLSPFKLGINFLHGAGTSNEFGSFNWVSSDLRKTCGDFRIGMYETSTALNTFSHQITWDKGPRGIISIYPQKGDIWAVYRNWSPDWNGNTPDNVMQVYDLVEVLDDYDDEHGISVAPLIKVAGFRTVFRRCPDGYAIKRIMKEEMLRFSHQVPFYRMTGEEAPDVPLGCYEVDPAALSKELLEEMTEAVEEGNKIPGEEAL